MGETVNDWKLYEAGKKYNNAIKCINNANYYDLVNTLIDFYNGNQWRNLEISGMRKPVFNILRKAIPFWVASIAANNTKINLEPLEYSQDSPTEQMNIAELASSELMNLFEKFKMDNRIRDALFKAGIMGDVAAHLYFDPNKKPYGGAFQDVKGEICFELVNGTNIFFGNANNSDKEIQPWIGLSGRDMVESLKREAKEHKKNEGQEDGITEDNNTRWEAGSDAEIEIEADGYGKATYFMVYRRDPETNTIKVSKCVESAYIYKDVDTELSVYPIAWLPWDKQENQYHGKPPCAEILETQIFINLMFAMIMYHLAMTAFPKAVYNADVIKNWSNQIAESIPVSGMQFGENIKNVAGYLEPGQMSNQIVQVIELAYDYVKDLLGINDGAMGNINPEQTSGKAILATVKQTSIPLENPKANMYEWVEDIGRICLDMMGTYYGPRPIVVSKDGNRTIQNFDFTQLKDIWLNVRVDVGTTNVWSDMARKQTLDNLFTQGKIELIDYLERLDDADIPDRQGLIDKIKKTMQTQQQLTPEQVLAQLTPEERANFMQLSPEEQQAMMQQLMAEMQQQPMMNQV